MKDMIITILFLVCVFISGYGLGVYRTESHYKSISNENKETVSQHDKVAEKSIERVSQASTVITKEVPKIVERTVYKNICIDDDGLEVLKNLKESKQ